MASERGVFSARGDFGTCACNTLGKYACTAASGSSWWSAIVAVVLRLEDGDSSNSSPPNAWPSAASKLAAWDKRDGTRRGEYDLAVLLWQRGDVGVPGREHLGILVSTLSGSGVATMRSTRWLMDSWEGSSPSGGNSSSCSSSRPLSIASVADLVGYGSKLQHPDRSRHSRQQGQGAAQRDKIMRSYLIMGMVSCRTTDATCMRRSLEESGASRASISCCK